MGINFKYNKTRFGNNVYLRTFGTSKNNIKMRKQTKQNKTKQNKTKQNKNK